jgi:hypothetical protein
MPAATFDLEHAHLGLDRILAWVTLTLEGIRYPWAGVAIADPVAYEDGYKEARLLLVEDIVLALSDRTGRMQATKAVFTLSDIPDPLTGDTVVRKWLGQHKTLRGATIDIKFLTDAQRRSGDTPAVAFRGRIDRYAGPAGFQARFECSGIVGSRLDQMVVDDTIGRHFPGAPAATAGLPLPIAYGNLTDAGTASPRGYVTPVLIGELLDLFSATWTVFVYAAHACDIATPPELFLVDTDGTVTAVDTGTYGITVTAPGHTGYATYWGAGPYYTDGLGHRWMILAFKGPDGAALLAGTKTLRANVLGAEPVGDGTGTVVTSIYTQLAHLVDNFAFLAETSVLGGNWRTTIPAFDDATPKRDAASFTLAATNAGVVLAGNDGARFLSERTTFGDLIAEILRSGHARAGINAAGQFQVVVPNQTQTPAATVTEALEILRDSFSWMDDDQLGFANAQPFGYAPAHETAGTAPTLTTFATLEDTDSQTRYQERKQADRLDLEWKIDPTQAAAVAAVELEESSDIPRQVTLSSGIHWSMLKLGDIVKVTHLEGPKGGGWVERGIFILGQSISLGKLSVELTCLDFAGAVASPSTSLSSSPSSSPSASPSVSSSPSASPSATPSASPSPSATGTASASPSASVSSSPSNSISSSPSPSHTPSASISSSPSTSISSSPSPSETPSSSPSSSDSASPSSSPSPSNTPSASPSDHDPDAFGIAANISHADPDTLYLSGAFEPVGYDAPSAISISSDASVAEFSINGGGWVTSGTVSPSDLIDVRVQSGGGGSTVTTTVTIGGTTSDEWTIEVDPV